MCRFYILLIWNSSLRCRRLVVNHEQQWGDECLFDQGVFLLKWSFTWSDNDKHRQKKYCLNSLQTVIVNKKPKMDFSYCLNLWQNKVCITVIGLVGRVLWCWNVVQTQTWFRQFYLQFLLLTFPMMVVTSAVKRNRKTVWTLRNSSSWSHVHWFCTGV